MGNGRKTIMSFESECGLAADTKVETPEGPMTVRGLAGKSISVFTRDHAGTVVFRPTADVRKIADDAPVLRIALDNGWSFRVIPGQILFTVAMEPIRAAELKAGNELLPAFHYPAGYHYFTDQGEERVSTAALRVAEIAPPGAAEVYSLRVKQTGCFFLSAGVLCRAEAAPIDPAVHAD